MAEIVRGSSGVNIVNVINIVMLISLKVVIFEIRQVDNFKRINCISNNSIVKAIVPTNLLSSLHHSYIHMYMRSFVCLSSKCIVEDRIFIKTADTDSFALFINVIKCNCQILEQKVYQVPIQFYM